MANKVGNLQIHPKSNQSLLILKNTIKMAKDKATVQSVNAQIEALVKGDTLLVQAIKTQNPDKVQLEFAEKTQAVAGNSSALLGLLNQNDDRFSSGARRAWITAEIIDLADKMDLNCGDDADWVDHPTKAGKEVLPIGQMNPELGGLRLRVQIEETTEATEYQADHIEDSAKRKGADGDFITCGGEYIFSNTVVVPIAEGEEPTHTILKADAVTVKTGVNDEVGM